MHCSPLFNFQKLIQINSHADSQLYISDISCRAVSTGTAHWFSDEQIFYCLAPVRQW